MKQARLATWVLLATAALVLLSCGAGQSNEITIDSIVPSALSIVAPNTNAYTEVEIVGRVSSLETGLEGTPIADAEVIVSAPYNEAFPVTDNTNPFLIYDSIDSSVRTQITGNYFTITTDDSGIFRFAVSIPLGGEYTANIYFIVGSFSLDYDITVATE
jgi:hypothetical protein